MINRITKFHFYGKLYTQDTLRGLDLIKIVSSLIRELSIIQVYKQIRFIHLVKESQIWNIIRLMYCYFHKHYFFRFFLQIKTFLHIRHNYHFSYGIKSLNVLNNIFKSIKKEQSSPYSASHCSCSSQVGVGLSFKTSGGNKSPLTLNLFSHNQKNIYCI